MKVKIKQGNEMINATIEMVDGVMVVSPKKEMFEPENGDIVTTERGEHIFLCKDYIGEGYIYAHFGYNTITGSCYYKGEFVARRYATEKEKQKLFDKIKEVGYEWDVDKKELVKLKWKPYEGGYFWLPYYNSMMFAPTKGMFNIGRDKSFLDKDWVFRTEEECQAFCGRLNEVINSVKP